MESCQHHRSIRMCEPLPTAAASLPVVYSARRQRTGPRRPARRVGGWAVRTPGLLNAIGLRHSWIVASMVKRWRTFSQLAYGSGMHRIHRQARINHDYVADVPGGGDGLRGARGCGARAPRRPSVHQAQQCVRGARVRQVEQGRLAAPAEIATRRWWRLPLGSGASVCALARALVRPWPITAAGTTPHNRGPLRPGPHRAWLRP
jgi:hypothetical protein